MRVRTLLLAVVPLLGGCAVVGPTSISNGRGVYNEIITRTDDEQILNMIVRDRYDDTFGMLAVTSVTANIKFRASAGANFGIGSSGSYERNLVPLSAGVAYEENPTISYRPLGGENFLRAMLTPITPEQGYMLMDFGDEHERWIYELYDSVNGMRNPVRGLPPPDLERFVDLYGPIRKKGIATFGKAAASTDEREYVLRFAHYAPDHVDDLR
ncbi:MAG: hypothetical protein GY715_06005 [Planctomycetes bacterium]|nr:hypothetical protein [Planctomycetota bacterium]